MAGPVPDHEPKCECVSAAGPALRGAEPTEGFGDRSWLDGARADWELKVNARGGASVAPDANPYLVLYSLFKTGIDGSTAKVDNLRQAERYLPDNIYDAIADFRSAEWISEILGEDVKGRFADLKLASAERCARMLGTYVKGPEVQYHHEVYNQALWNLF